MADTDLQTNAADPAQVDRGKRKERDRERRRRALLRQQLSTADGREFVWTELAAAGIFEDCYGSIEAVSAFLGRRRRGLELLVELMTFHAREYLLMQSEALSRDERERRENVAARTTPAARE